MSIELYAKNFKIKYLDTLQSRIEHKNFPGKFYSIKS